MFVIAAALLVAFTELSGKAQDFPDVAQGLQPYVAFHGGNLDQVNLQNGALTIRIPLVEYPQKGSLPTLSYSVLFNSFGFEDVGNCISADGVTGPIATIPLHNGCTNTIKVIPTGILGNFALGPRLIADQTLQAGGVAVVDNNDTPNPPMNARFYVVSADNAEHPLGIASDGTYRSIDGSSYMFVPSQPPSSANNNLGQQENDYSGDETRQMNLAPGTITDLHGVSFTATSITDLDGNSITIPSGSGGLPATDSAGRSIPALTSVNTSGCPNLSQAQNQPLSSAMSWTPPGTGNGFLFCYANVHIESTFFWVRGSGSSQYNRTVSMLQSIVLPNNTYWGFIYDSYSGSGSTTGTGNLTTLIYPTGGTVSYTYPNEGGYEGLCDSNRESGLVPASVFTYPASVQTRTMTDPVNGVVGTWTYGYPSSADGSTTGSVLSPMGDLTVTKWTPDNSGSACGLLSAGEDEYQGNPSSPSPSNALRSTTITYTGQQAAWPPYVNTLRKLQETTTLNGSVTSSVTHGYAPGVSLAILSCDQYGNNCTTGTSTSTYVGDPTSATYIDFSGSALKQETTTYQWQNSQNYWAVNLLDIPATTQLLDGGSNVYASTTYTYDESGYLASSGIKGHPTTVTRLLTSNPSASPVTHTWWNASGMKSGILDGDGNRNTQGYTASYQYNQCNGASLTDTYDAVNDHVSGGYDCSSGRLASYVDANGNTTGISYDGLGRILNVTYPSILTSAGSGNPSTTFTYNDSSNQVVRTIAATPDPTQTTTVNFDGFGREIQRQTATGGTPITVTTTYDAGGRTHFVSNPYYGTGDSTYGVTTFAYDGINRKTTQTQPDGGSTLQWSYSGNNVYAYDELGHERQQTSDALGRLTTVVEPDPSSGALTLQTNYTYDPLNDLLSVYQAGKSGDTARARIFTYDSLSRLITALNPEAGWVCYGTTGGAGANGSNCTSGYDANGNLLYKTDARGVTVHYGYDGLNRLVSKTYQYDNSGTPSSCYQYGLTSTATAGANQIGRLMSAWTQKASAGSCSSSAGYLTLHSILSYDAMGHIVTDQQCAPSGCANGSPYQVNYGYDLAGNVSYLTNGITATPGTSTQLGFTSAHDAAGRLLTLTSTWNDSTHPQSLFSGASYAAPGGLTAATFGNGLAISRNYNKRLWPVGETDSGTTSTPATAGWAAITITGAEQSH